MLRQQRHHLLTQCVAAISGVPVAFVVDPCNALFPRGAQQLDARNGQQRPQLGCAPAGPVVPFGHGRQTFRAGTAQQLQQKRLGLIVLMVCREKKIRIQRGKDPLAFPPRGRLDAGRVVARDLHAMDGQFNCVRCA